MYFKDVQKIQGFDRNAVIHGRLSLDKDKLQIYASKKIYSKETCVWISMKEQSRYVDHESCKNNYKIEFKYIDLDGNEHIYKGIGKFSREFNVPKTSIQKCLNGTQKSSCGYKFMRIT